MLSSGSSIAYGLNLTSQDQSDIFFIHWLNKTIHAAIKLMYDIGCQKLYIYYLSNTIRVCKTI